jgi:putative transposase
MMEEGVMSLYGNGLRFGPRHLYRCKKVSVFLIDETMIQIGYSEAWLWVAVEPIHKQILGVYISRHRNMIVAESFLRSLIKIYGENTVYSDGETWYPEPCISLGLKHRLHSSYEKSIVERIIEYLKDRTEAFDDYFPCIRRRRTKGLQSTACLQMANSLCVYA